MIRTCFRHPLPALLASLCLVVGACGGGGGGGPGGGPPVGGAPPTGVFQSPTAALIGLPGDVVSVRFVASDDGVAQVRLLLDADLNLNTTPDQIPVLGPVNDTNATPVNAVFALPPVPGAYLLVLSVDDGSNPVLQLTLPALVQTGIAGVAPPRSNAYGISGSTVLFTRGEAEDGAVALNGDGLADDGVMALYNATTNVLTNGGVAADVTSVAGGRAQFLGGGGGIVAWKTLEADAGASLNAANTQSAPDADAADSMVAYWNPAIQALPIVNTFAGAGTFLKHDADRLVVAWNEAQNGPAGTDLNADGNAVDTIFGYLDLSKPAAPFERQQALMFPRAPAPGSTAWRSDAGVAAGYIVSEAANVGAPNADINADADTTDSYLFLVNTQPPSPGAGQIVGILPAPAPFPLGPVPVSGTAAFDVVAGPVAGAYLDEVGAGQDLDGSGGIAGFVPAIFDQLAATTTVPVSPAGFLDAGVGAPTLFIDGPRMFFTAMEAGRVGAVAGSNNDADGGGDTQILYWVDRTILPMTAHPLAVNLGGGIPLTALALDGGSATRLAAGWVSLVVNEATNGNYDINGNGAVDSALLLVDTDLIDPITLSPTVYNPMLAPSAAGNIPLGGVYGAFPGVADEGLIVRALEVQNGILNGDGDNTDTLLVVIRFSNPTVFTQLGIGGDLVKVAAGIIGVTANEAFTNTDLAGNGGTTDFAFCLLDVTGTLLTAKLCSQHSLPASNDGVLWAYLRSEVAEARFLNGDADQADVVLGLYSR